MEEVNDWVKVNFLTRSLICVSLALMEERVFWTDARKRLISKALINLFQALVIALFISEAFLKATLLWRAAFILTIILSLSGAVLICPKGDSEEN